MRAIRYTRGTDKKVRLYRELIGLTQKSLAYVQDADRTLRASACGALPAYAAWSADVTHYRPLIERVIDQTKRRVLRECSSRLNLSFVQRR